MSGYSCGECGHKQEHLDEPKRMVRVDGIPYCNEPECLPLALITGLSPSLDGVYKIAGAYPSMDRDNGEPYHIRHLTPAHESSVQLLRDSLCGPDEVDRYFERLPQMLKRASMPTLAWVATQIQEAGKALLARVGQG